MAEPIPLVKVALFAFTFVCRSGVTIAVEWIFAIAGFGAIPAILVSWTCRRSLTVIAFPALCAAAGTDTKDTVARFTDVCAVTLFFTIRSKAPCWTITVVDVAMLPSFVFV